MSTYNDLISAVAKVVGGNQPDAVNKPNWFSGKDVGDSSGVSGLAGAWWPPPDVVQDTPVALIIPGPGKLLQPYPMQGHKQVQDEIHVRVMVGHADLPTTWATVVPFRDSVPSAFDSHMMLFSALNVVSANCDGPDFLELEWGGSPYAALEFVVRVERSVAVTYVG